MQRVLESKTNLTKFARFYLMILSHTSIIIYHYQRCCRIPLLQPQLILTSSTSTTNTITTVTTTTTTTAIATTTTTAAAAITTSAIIAALLLFTTYCMHTSTYVKRFFVYTSTLVSTVIISRCFLFCVDGNATPRNNKTLYIM